MKAKSKSKNRKIRSIRKSKKGFHIEARPLTETQISEFVSFFNKNNRFPGSKIPCSVTGKLTTCVGPWMQKKLVEFGSAENLLRNYKCRGVLKTQRQLIKPVTKRKIKTKKLKDEQKNWSIPKIEFAPPRPLTQSELEETTRTQCLRPDIFISNGRHCESCEFFKFCQCDIKTMPKPEKSRRHK